MALSEFSKFGPDYSKLEMETYVESLELLDKKKSDDLWGNNILMDEKR